MSKNRKISAKFVAENVHKYWGTYGLSGEQKIKWVWLYNCFTAHLGNILKDNEKFHNLDNIRKTYIQSLILQRLDGRIKRYQDISS